MNICTDGIANPPRTGITPIIDSPDGSSQAWKRGRAMPEKLAFSRLRCVRALDAGGCLLIGRSLPPWLRGLTALAAAAVVTWAAISAEPWGHGPARPLRVTAFASANEFTARFAVDGQEATRWDTGAPQAGGEWLLLDLGEVKDIAALILDTQGSPSDFARGVRIEGSLDGKSFTPIMTVVDAPATDLQIFPFPAPARYRFFRVTQTGFAESRYWSVHEARVEECSAAALPSRAARWLRFLGLVLPALSALGAIVALLALVRSGKLAAGSVAAACCILFAVAMAVSGFLMNRPDRAGSVFWIPGPIWGEEGVWGFDWLRDHSPIARLAAVFLVLAAAVPAINRLLRRTALGLLLILGRQLGRTVSFLVPFGMALTGWWLRSATLYGDGAGTSDILLGNKEWMNWKEPLDRLITVIVYRLLHVSGHWQPAEAIALVSCVAGIAYWATIIGIARLLTKDGRRQIAIFLLLSCVGVTQLFFGNIENYSLLGAGIMLYLYLGLRFLRSGRGLALAAWTLGLTVCVHLSAVWLLPTLGVLVLLRLEGYRQSGARHPWRIPREEAVRLAKQMGVGVLGIAVVGLLTFALGIHLIGNAGGLSSANFGGGDGKVFMPFLHASTMYEKYTVLSWAHLVATVNLLLLLCPGMLILASSYLLFTPPERRRYDRSILFLSAAATCCLAYVFFFNPDHAIYGVGVLNEWDLFSLPAFPIALLGVYLWLEWEPAAERQAYLATLVVCTGFIHAAAWILSNARVLI